MDIHGEAREMVPLGDVTADVTEHDVIDTRRDVMADELLQELRSAEAFVMEGENEKEEGSLRHEENERNGKKAIDDLNEADNIGREFASDGGLYKQETSDSRSVVSAEHPLHNNPGFNPLCDAEYKPLLPRSRNSSLWSVSSVGSRISSNKRCSRAMAEKQDDVAQLPTEDVTSGEEFVVVEENKPEGSKPPSRDPSPTNEKPEKPKKKKKRVKGLELPVQVFKSRSERDPEKINQDLRVNFDDVIAEPEGFYTPKYSWHLSKEVYGFSKGCCYSVASFFCSIPAAFLWGIWFAFIACLNIWLLVPLRRCHNIKMSLWKSFWGVFVSAIFDPIFQSIGMIFSNMKIQSDKYEV